MKVTRDELGSKWREALLAGPSGHEWRGIALSVRGPIGLLAGVREPDNRLALLIEGPLSVAPAALFRLSAEGVSVSDQRRPAEGLFRLAIALERDELRDVFEVLVLDVIDVVCTAGTPTEATRDVVRRLEAWQACLRLRRQRLSGEQQIGLMGELAVLRVVAGEIGYATAIEGWKGPLDGLHDFLRTGAAIEVKSVLGVGSLLRISSANQLETEGLSRLVLARPRFREDQAGHTLSESVSSIRAEVERSAAAALRELNDKLLRAGFLDGEDHDGPRAALHDFYGFEVRDSFPRITARLLPAAIVDVAYSLEERALSPFRVGREFIHRFARDMAGSE